MPFDGAGNYSLPLDFSVRDSAGIPILASDFDTQYEDIAVAINKMLTRDGQGGPSANLPMATFKHTNVAKSSALTEYARTDQIQNGAFNVLNSASITGNATLGGTTNPSFSAYTKGQKFLMELSAAIVPASTSATLNINGISALPITYRDGTVPESTHWGAGVYLFFYNSNANRFEIISSLGIATGANVIAGSGRAILTPAAHGVISRVAIIAPVNGMGESAAATGVYTEHGTLRTVSFDGLLKLSSASTMSIVVTALSGKNATAITHPCFVYDNGVRKLGFYQVNSATITFNISTSGEFAVSGNKGFDGFSFTVDRG